MPMKIFGWGKEEEQPSEKKASLILPEEQRDLAGLRSEIDDIDAELLQLLARRMDVSAQIGEYKKQNNVTVVQMDRWKKVLADHVTTGADLGLSEEMITEIFEAIHQASIERQSRIMETDGDTL